MIASGLGCETQTLSLSYVGCLYLVEAHGLSRCSSLASLALLTVVIDSAVNMGTKICLSLSPAFNYFGSIPRSRIAGSYGSSVF